MPRDHDRNEQFEWVNAWAASSKSAAASVATAELDITSSAPQKAPDTIMLDPADAPLTPALPPDQLTLDLAEIERARDALAALPVGTFSARQQRTQALMLIPSRTSDSVPVFVGGVLALVMLTVFGAAAAMTKLTR